jgi:hypothetical protein
VSYTERLFANTNFFDSVGLVAERWVSAGPEEGNEDRAGADELRAGRVKMAEDGRSPLA